MKKLRSKLNLTDKLEQEALIKDLQQSDKESKKKLSNEQLLSTISVLDLSVDKYDKFRALTGPEIVSHYNTVMKYRDSVVLPQIQTIVVLLLCTKWFIILGNDYYSTWQIRQMFFVTLVKKTDIRFSS